MTNIIKLINEAIDVCNKELLEIEKGKLSEATIEQIRDVIIPDLEKTKCLIENNELPPKKDRYLLSFAYAFKVWNWNMQNPTKLYNLLGKINNIYKNG